MSLDIIIYVLVAAILLLRLWSLLGQRNDDEIERPNPFTPKSPEQNKIETVLAPETKTADPSAVLKLMTVAPASLAGGLEQIRLRDPGFDEKKFLQGARQAFSMIIENFSHDNLAPIQRLLGPDVLPHFQRAIAVRQKAGHRMESKILRIVEAETTAANVSGSRAIVTVRFVSEQENVLRDQNGQLIGGEAGKVEQVTDIWTFARDLESADPNWTLIETRG